MSEKILVPVLGESISEATVSKWLKNEGDSVEADEPIVELETDKVNLEVPSPVTGTLIVQASTTASLVLSSNQNTLNQSVCNNTAIDPVVFQLGGNATTANVTGLPDGIASTLDASLNTITLRGSPSVSVATSTTYTYNISNANGSPTRTVTGSITVNLPSQISLTSVNRPVIAAAAAIAGLIKWVRPPRPCRPSKFLFDVAAHLSSGNN